MINIKHKTIICGKLAIIMLNVETPNIFTQDQGESQVQLLSVLLLNIVLEALVSEIIQEKIYMACRQKEAEKWSLFLNDPIPRNAKEETKSK